MRLLRGLLPRCLIAFLATVPLVLAAQAPSPKQAEALKRADTVIGFPHGKEKLRLEQRLAREVGLDLRLRQFHGGPVE